MKTFGYWLIGIGVIYLLIAFNMDVSVSAPSTYVPGYGSVGGGNVANLDLMARRQNHLMVAALITLIGALMAIFGKNQSESVSLDNSAGNAPAEFTAEHDLSSDAYRLWLVKHHQIERNEVFDRFIVDEQTFNTLDDALAYAHALDAQQIAEEKAEADRLEAECAANRETAQLAAEKADAEWQKAKSKIIAVIIIAIGLSVAAYFLLRETPQERAARVIREETERVEAIKTSEQKFKISLPEDSTDIEEVKKAEHEYICDDKRNGTILKFNTKLSEEAVKDHLSKKLGKGEPKYQYLVNEFDWIWRKNGIHYELSVFHEGSPTQVNLCVTE
jgi:hypothetical protein